MWSHQNDLTCQKKEIFSTKSTIHPSSSFFRCIKKFCLWFFHLGWGFDKQRAKLRYNCKTCNSCGIHAPGQRRRTSTTVGWSQKGERGGEWWNPGFLSKAVFKDEMLGAKSEVALMSQAEGVWPKVFLWHDNFLIHVWKPGSEWTRTTASLTSSPWNKTGSNGCVWRCAVRIALHFAVVLCHRPEWTVEMRNSLQLDCRKPVTTCSGDVKPIRPREN